MNREMHNREQKNTESIYRNRKHTENYKQATEMEQKTKQNTETITASALNWIEQRRQTSQKLQVKGRL